MKRYALFSFDQYYPKGGMEDFVGFFDTVHEARNVNIKRWYQIVDTSNWCVVEQN
jgi:hypothetical protein